MARTLLRWLPFIVWAALFTYLNRYHFIIVTHYNAFLIILLASVVIIVMIYKYVLKESQKS